MKIRHVALSLFLTGMPGAALAQESSAAIGDDGAFLLDEAEGRLLHHPGMAGYHVPGGAPAGYLVGLDVGAAIPVPSGSMESQPSLSLSGRVGYQFHSGLALAARYEDLGLSPNLIDGKQLQFVAADIRYNFPFLLPMPFVEAAFGLAIATSNAALAPGQGNVSAGPGGALGVGVSFPLTHNFAIDVGVRDWLASVDGSFYQVFSIEAGVAFAFGGH
ncbi:MAG: hypothetical protein ACYDCL_10250 [Myxococcales bacterium]